MAINKIQITLISLINAVSAIYSWICVSEYGIIYKSFDSNASQIWLSTIFMGIIAGLTAIYFTLMCLYSAACTCLTGDDSNQKPTFSVCGCLSIVVAICTYLWGWMMFLTVGDDTRPI